MRKEITLAILITVCTLAALFVNFRTDRIFKNPVKNNIAEAPDKVVPEIKNQEEKPIQEDSRPSSFKVSKDYSTTLNSFKREAKKQFKSLPRDSGTGVFTGEVKMESGQALPDVKVKVERTDNAKRHIQSYRKNWQMLDIDEKIENYIRNLESSQANSYEATTDANGKFRIDGLPAGKYWVTAFLEGYEIKDISKRQSNYEPDAEVDFEAKKLLEVRVEVLMPDGKSADFAFVTIKYDRRGYSSSGSSAWSPENDTVSIAEEGGVILSAKTQDEELSSENCKIVADPENMPELVTLKLKSWPGIKGRVIFDGEIGDEQSNLYVYAILNKHDREAEIEFLRQGKESYPRSYNGYKYTFSRLIPGKYSLGCVFGELIFTSQVVVSDKMEEKDIHVSMANTDSIIMRVINPDGKPVRDCQISAISIKKTDNSTNSETFETLNIQYFPGKNGSYCIPFSNFKPAVLDASGTELVFTVKSSSYGEKQVSVSTPPPKEIDVKFEEQGFFTVHISNFGVRGYEDRLKFELEKEETETSSRIIHRSYNSQNQFFNSENDLTFEPVQPGNYNLVISVKTDRWQFVNVSQFPVTIKAGTNRLTVELPELYKFQVNSDSGKAGKNVCLKKEKADEIDGKFNVDGVAKFYDLPAGNYTLSVDGDSENITIPNMTEINYE